MIDKINTKRFKLAVLMIFFVASSAYGQTKTTISNSSADIWINSSKGGLTTVEFVSDGKVSGLQFDITMPKTMVKDTSVNCGLSLPSTHTAVCKQHDKFLRVVVFSMDSAILTDATIVEFAAPTQQNAYASKSNLKTRKMSLKNVILADSAGQEITPEYL